MLLCLGMMRKRRRVVEGSFMDDVHLQKSWFGYLIHSLRLI